MVLQIIRTNHTITIDQTEYIFRVSQNFEKIKLLSTPMEYDNEFERGLLKVMPIDQQQLTKYSLKYHGIYWYHTDIISYAALYLTHWDI